MKIPISMSRGVPDPDPKSEVGVGDPKNFDILVGSGRVGISEKLRPLIRPYGLKLLNYKLFKLYNYLYDKLK